jgi:hypothetical protein
VGGGFFSFFFIVMILTTFPLGKGQIEDIYFQKESTTQGESEIGK